MIASFECRERTCAARAEAERAGVLRAVIDALRLGAAHFAQMEEAITAVLSVWVGERASAGPAEFYRISDAR